MVRLKLSFAVLLLFLFSCTNDDETVGDGNVVISTSGLNNGKLALNRSATFMANLPDYEGDTSNLTYRWSLDEGRGELSDGNNALSGTSDGENTVYCLGKRAGSEQITVEVLDNNNLVVGSAFMDFEIVMPTDPDISRGCYDQPKIIYQRNGVSGYVCNFDGLNQQYLGLSGSPSIAISPDGEWSAYNPYEVEDNPPIGYNMYLVRCDRSEIIRIPSDIVGYERYASDYLPEFSPDSKTLYFMRSNAAQEPVTNSSGFPDIAAYDLETGEVRYLTTLYQLGEGVGEFTVSPVTGDIAFLRQSYEYFADGSYKVTHKLSILQPETGYITDLTTLPQGRYDYGMDWSPDGGDIIYCASTVEGRGIFRINLTDGSQPHLLLPYTDDNTVPYNYPHYYEGGSRIIFGDNNENNVLTLYSVDENGNDLQQVGEFTGHTFLQGILD